MVIDVYNKPKTLWNFQLPFQQPKENYLIKYVFKVKCILFFQFLYTLVLYTNENFPHSLTRDKAEVLLNPFQYDQII